MSCSNCRTQPPKKPFPWCMCTLKHLIKTSDTSIMAHWNLRCEAPYSIYSRSERLWDPHTTLINNWLNDSLELQRQEGKRRLSRGWGCSQSLLCCFKCSLRCTVRETGGYFYQEPLKNLTMGWEETALGGASCSRVAPWHHGLIWL